MASSPRTQPVGLPSIANPRPVVECRSRGEAARRGQTPVTGPQEALWQGEPVLLFVVGDTRKQAVAGVARPADGASTRVAHGQQASQVAVTCDRGGTVTRGAPCVACAGDA